jgi:hypothetical protein
MRAEEDVVVEPTRRRAGRDQPNRREHRSGNVLNVDEQLFNPSGGKKGSRDPSGIRGGSMLRASTGRTCSKKALSSTGS